MSLAIPGPSQTSGTEGQKGVRDCAGLLAVPVLRAEVTFLFVHDAQP